MKLIFLTKELHILFMNSWYPSRVMPTNGDFIQRHAEAVALKHRVTAIHIVSDTNMKRAFDLTDTIVNDVRTIIGYVKFTNNALLKWLRFLYAFRKVYSRVEAYDVIHVNRMYPLGIFALYLNYRKRKPFIISEHWTGLSKKNAMALSSLEKIVSKKLVAKAHFVCPVSQDLAHSMQLLGFRGNFHVVPNVVDTQLFVPKNIKNDRFTLLHVSNMVDQHKNVSGLLNVTRQLKKIIPNLRFVFVGGDSKNYSDQIDKFSLQDTVEIFPQQAHPKIVEFMQAADVFVLFSNYENLPCVILEAFSCGLPVISTDVGGISEFFPKEFGYLIPNNDEQLLIETLEIFYKNHISYNSDKMHQYAQDNFSKEVICSTFSSYYQRAMTI